MLMKVVQINAIYGSKSTGTIVREIQSCSEQHGIEGYVAYSISNIPKSDITKGYRIGNRMTAKWHALFSRVIGKQAYANCITTWFFLRWLDKINPDIVHLHNLHSNYIHLNMLLSYLAKHDIATIITMHDCWYFTGGCMHYSSIGCDKWKSGCGNCPIWKKLPSLIFDRTHEVLADRKKYLNSIPRLKIVGCSEWIANEGRQSFLRGGDITFIHNGFDLNIFSPTETHKRKKLGLEKKFVIIGPASKWLLPVNKPTLDYFTSNMVEDMVLVLFGGSGNASMLPSNVHLLGYTKDPKEMAEIYSMADVMVNCSREDTLSSINLECQACGTPVVAYDNTGVRETIEEKCDLAVATGDYEDLFSKVKKVKEKGKDAYSEQCRVWILANYEKNNSYIKYIQLYHTLNEK